MRVLLDESVLKRLGTLLGPHVVATVSQRGWQSVSNGELLARAAAEFDVLVTADQRMERQQNIPRLHIGVIVLKAHRNRLRDYEPLVPAILSAIDRVQPGAVVRVAA